MPIQLPNLNLNRNFLQPFLQGAGQSIAGNLFNPQRLGQQVGGFLSNPRNLAGLGLAGIGLNQPTEPGAITETRQAQRELAVNPQAFGNRLTQNVQAIEPGLRPIFNQQVERGGSDIQRRFAAAFPSSVGAQGGEFAALSRNLSENILPSQQQLLTNLGLQGINQQNLAAGQVLEHRPGSSLGENLGALGGLLLANQGGGAFGGGVFGGGQQLIDQAGNVMGAINPTTGQLIPANFGNQLSQAVLQASTTGDIAQLAQLLASGALIGQPFPFGVQASTPVGQLVQQAINAGLVESPAAQVISPGAGAAGGGGFQGIFGAPGLGSVGGIASGLASAGAGYAAGQFIGPRAADLSQSDNRLLRFGLNPAGSIAESLGASEQATAALGGAGAGALTGLALGGHIGAGIGAIAGAFGGFQKQRAQEHAIKEARRAADVTGRTNLVAGIGAFFNDTIAQLGVGDSAISSSTVQFARDAVDDLVGGVNIPGSAFSAIIGKTPSQAINEFTRLVPDDVHSRVMIGATLGKHLSEELDRNPVTLPDGTKVNHVAKVPGLKDSFIDTLTSLFSSIGVPQGFDESSERNLFAQTAQFGRV